MRELIFMGDSREVLDGFPDEVRRDIGYTLWFAQEGKTHEKAKPFKGYPGVFEIVTPYMRDAYRTVYALKIGKHIYVLHVFQKKSTQGIKTPKRDLELIEMRYKAAKRWEEFNV